MAQLTLLIPLCLLIANGFGTAPKPWIVYPGSENQYQFNNDETSWIFARERCLAQNADLVSINNETELNWLMSHYPIQGLTEKRYILVGLLLNSNSQWGKWVDGTDLDISVTPMHSNSAFPQFGCAQWEVHNAYLDRALVKCDDRNGLPLHTRFICERTPEQTQAVLGAVVVGELSVEAQKMEALQNQKDMNCKEGLISDDCVNTN